MKLMLTGLCSIAWLTFFLTAVFADIPWYADYHYHQDNSFGFWFKDKDPDPGKYGRPSWDSEYKVLTIPNVGIADNVKHLWFEIEYSSQKPIPLTPPDITLSVTAEGDAQVTPSEREVVSRSITYEWLIDPQPGWEKITFAAPFIVNGLMLNDPLVTRIEVGTWCSEPDAPRPVPAPNSVVLCVIGVMLIAVTRRVRWV